VLISGTDFMPMQYAYRTTSARMQPMGFQSHTMRISLRIHQQGTTLRPLQGLYLKSARWLLVGCWWHGLSGLDSGNPVPSHSF